MEGGVRLSDITLEDSGEYLEGQNKVMFLRFMRKMLQWDPDKRQDAHELLEDPWLNNFWRLSPSILCESPSLWAKKKYCLFQDT